jgi:hypothetical protein
MYTRIRNVMCRITSYLSFLWKRSKFNETKLIICQYHSIYNYLFMWNIWLDSYRKCFLRFLKKVMNRSGVTVFRWYIEIRFLPIFHDLQCHSSVLQEFERKWAKYLHVDCDSCMQSQWIIALSVSKVLRTADPCRIIILQYMHAHTIARPRLLRRYCKLQPLASGVLLALCSPPSQNHPCETEWLHVVHFKTREGGGHITGWQTC